MKQAIAFMSYSRFDDEHDKQRLTLFRERLEGEVRAQTGATFTIFQDRDGIGWGQNWKGSIKASLDSVTFLIPILTPNFFKSSACREEVERFRARERELNRTDLILPVYYIDYPPFNDDTQRAGDELAQVIHEHQYIDWRNLRHTSLNTVTARKQMEKLALQLRDAIERTNATQSGKPVIEPTKGIPRNSHSASTAKVEQETEDIAAQGDASPDILNEPPKKQSSNNGDAAPQVVNDTQVNDTHMKDEQQHLLARTLTFLRWLWGVLIIPLAISVVANLISSGGQWRWLIGVIASGVSITLWVLWNYVVKSHLPFGNILRLLAVLASIVTIGTLSHLDLLFYDGAPSANHLPTGTTRPTNIVTVAPSGTPTATREPTSMPATAPTSRPAITPTREPTPAPTSGPTTAPTSKPTAMSASLPSKVSPEDIQTALQSVPTTSSNNNSSSNQAITVIRANRPARYKKTLINHGLQLFNGETYGSTYEVLNLGKRYTFLTGNAYNDSSTPPGSSPTLNFYDIGNADPTAANASTIAEGKPIFNYTFNQADSRYSFAIDVRGIKALGIVLTNAGTVDVVANFHTSQAYRGHCSSVASTDFPIECLPVFVTSSSNSTDYTVNAIPQGNAAEVKGKTITDGLQLVNNGTSGTAYEVLNLGNKYSYISGIVYNDDFTSQGHYPAINFYDISGADPYAATSSNIEEGRPILRYRFQQTNDSFSFSVDVRGIKTLGVTLEGDSGAADIVAKLHSSQAYRGLCSTLLSVTTPLECMRLIATSSTSSTSDRAEVIPVGNSALYSNTPITNGLQLVNGESYDYSGPIELDSQEATKRV